MDTNVNVRMFFGVVRSRFQPNKASQRGKGKLISYLSSRFQG